ncbi:MAG: hypothetical protein ABFC28_03825 [Rikenellaceae bacterium]
MKKKKLFTTEERLKKLKELSNPEMGSLSSGVDYSNFTASFNPGGPGGTVGVHIPF